MRINTLHEGDDDDDDDDNNNNNNNNNNNRMCAHLHFNICNETGVKLDNKHWYVYVPKSVETSHEGKVTTLWKEQVKTETCLTINRTS
jgi:hypothetical protein